MHLQTEGEEQFDEEMGKSMPEDEKGQGGQCTEGGRKGETKEMWQTQGS